MHRDVIVSMSGRVMIIVYLAILNIVNEGIYNRNIMHNIVKQ